MEKSLNCFLKFQLIFYVLLPWIFHYCSFTNGIQESFASYFRDRLTNADHGVAPRPLKNKDL